MIRKQSGNHCPTCVRVKSQVHKDSLGVLRLFVLLTLNY